MRLDMVLDIVVLICCLIYLYWEQISNFIGLERKGEK
jgi:hypothetical protein